MRPRRRWRLLTARRVSGAAGLCLLTACASSPEPARSTPRAASATAVLPAPATTPCVAHSAAVVTPPGPVSAQPIDLVISGLANPDDLLIVNDRIQVGELAANRIRVVSAGLPPATLPVTTPTVEGMTMLNGVLYVADQAGDRVNAVTATGLRTVVQLRPVSGVDGLDSIGSTATSLLVPDSARGTVMVVTPEGRTLRSIAGFSRPTAALQLADGSLLVADENANQVVSVAVGGARNVVARGLRSVDDVAVDSTGVQFAVTETASGRVVQLRAGAAVDIVTSLAQPQGLAVDGADNLLVTESRAGRLELVVRTFRALPLEGPQVRNQPLCVDVQRAPGFGGDVQLSGAAGVSVLSQPRPGVAATVLLGSCQSPCRLTARSGALESTIWVAAAG